MRNANWQKVFVFGALAAFLSYCAGRAILSTPQPSLGTYVGAFLTPAICLVFALRSLSAVWRSQHQ